MNKRILEWPHPLLRKECQPVFKYDENLLKLAEDLVDTCNVNMGIGLAAPQIGVSKRVFVIQPSRFGIQNPDPMEKNKDYMVLVNPVVVTSEEKSPKWEEGCLSFPSTSGRVERYKSCNVTYMNLSGEMKTLECAWPFAGGIQHEADHLDGITFIFKQSKGNRVRTLRTYQKHKKKRIRAERKAKKGGLP